MSKSLSLSKLLTSESSMSSMSSESTQTNGLLTKWKTALIIGTPLLLGTGFGLYYYYYYRKRDDNKTNVKKIVVDKTETEIDIKDPFEKAMSFKSKGNKLFKSGKYMEAIECYTNAITECPDNKTDDLSTFYQNRAASYEMLKKFREVIDDCNKAIQLNNRYVKALVRRAKAHEAMGHMSDALSDITAVCILEQFQNQNNLLMTDRLLKQQSKIKAKALFKTRKPRMPSKHFIRHYFMSYSRDPIFKNDDSSEIVEGLETLRLKQEESGDSPLPEYLLLKGTVEILKGNIEEGEQDLEKLINLSECDNAIKVNALIKLGTIRVQDIGKDDSIKSALNCFEEAVKLDENNPDIYLHRAQIHLLAEQVDDARKDLEKCCELNDGFASALAQKLYVQFRCGVRYNDESTVTKALKGFDEASQRFSFSSEVHSLYAQALMEKGDYSKADHYFNKAIEKDPIDGNLYVHRGILYLQWNNDVDKAVNYLEEAKRVDPSCQFAFEMLGSISVQKGNLIKGMKYFDKALELAQTELDCAHLYSLRDAAEAQEKATKLLGIELPDS
jgi:import receptor subunit TOM70